MPAYQKIQQQSLQKKTNKANEKPGKRPAQTVSSDKLLKSPNSMNPEDILSAQQQVGNQTIQRALDLSAAREASTDRQGNLLPEISQEIQKERGSGNTLPKEVQTEVTNSFGRDFSSVRIHTDDKADKLSRTISARAFTIGKDIFFKKGAFDPSGSKGRETLLHELTHVVQQSAGSKSGSGTLKLGAIGSPHEHEAEHMAEKLGKQKQSLSKAGGATVQTQGEEDEVATQAEEEEIQTQGEEDEVATQAEEEEIQTQGEEDEVATQPDSAGGVVQRSFLDYFKKKPLSPDEEESRKKVETQKNGLMNMLRFGNKNEEGYKDSEHQLRTLHKTGMFSRNPATIALKQRKESDALRAKTKKVQAENEKERQEKAQKAKHDEMIKLAREGDPSALKQLKEQEAEKEKAKIKVKPVDPVDAQVKDKQSPQPKDQQPEKPKEKNVERRESLLAIIKNPNSTHDEMAKAEAELKKYHSRTLHSNYSKDAISERRDALKAKAQEGDKDAQEKLDALNKSNPNKTAKFKSFMGGAMSTIGGFLKSTALPGLKTMLASGLGGAAGSTKTLMTGPGAENKSGPAKEPGSSGGGGGGGGIAETISHLFQENMRLKNELEKLKSAKQ